MNIKGDENKLVAAEGLSAEKNKIIRD